MSTPSTPVRLALVGAGIFMRDAHVPSLLRQREHFEIVAVYSRSVESAAQLAVLLPGEPRIFTDFHELLADPTIEGVDVVLPIAAAQPYIVEALASGKHVISEKPIAVDSAAARELLNAYNQSTGPVWMVAENWRYESAFVEAAAVVRSGAIGQPLTCHWAIYAPILPGNKYYGSAWRESGQLPGGYLLDGGVHYAAGFRLLVGEIVAVSATVTQIAPHLPPADTISAHLRFANGAVGSYLASFGVAAPWPPHLYVVGTQGALRMQRGEVEVTRAGATRRITCEKYDGVEKELVAFAASIRTSAAHANGPEEAYRDLLVVEALLHSAATGQTVLIPEP
jgi:predicted dehydrogenase